LEGEGEKEFTPPYNITWTTLLNFMERLQGETLPNRIDRTYLSTYSGATQTYLISALRTFGFIGPNNEVLDSLREMVRNSDDRPKLIADLLRNHYPGPVRLGMTNATTGELIEAFDKDFGQKGNTARKAMTFFLHAAQYAGLQLSPHWKYSRPGPGGGPRPNRKPRAPKRLGAKDGSAPGADQHAPPQGNTDTVALGSGGTVTLTVSVNLFDLSTSDRDFVLHLIDKMKGYKSEKESAVPGDAESQ
jgi:hypothetical protein